MVVRTFRQCKKAIPEKNIVVATDSNKIVYICKKFDNANYHDFKKTSYWN